MTLKLLHSGFSGKFDFLFYQCRCFFTTYKNKVSAKIKVQSALSEVIYYG
jgi:hypothetical protein